MGSKSKWFSVSTFSDGKCTKKLLIKSSAAILMASTPRLAPRVPAPISLGTSINLIFFINAFKDDLSLQLNESHIRQVRTSRIYFKYPDSKQTNNGNYDFTTLWFQRFNSVCISGVVLIVQI